MGSNTLLRSQFLAGSNYCIPKTYLEKCALTCSHGPHSCPPHRKEKDGRTAEDGRQELAALQGTTSWSVFPASTVKSVILRKAGTRHPCLKTIRFNRKSHWPPPPAQLLCEREALRSLLLTHDQLISAPSGAGRGKNPRLVPLVTVIVIIVNYSS